MARPIRNTAFTWDPARESRAMVWNRIKAHIQRELDRVHAEYMLARRIARHQAHPRYVQNQQIVQAARDGTPVGELARRYGVSRQRVREILRSEMRWSGQHGGDHSNGPQRKPSQHGWSTERQLAGSVPRTTTMLRDP